MGYIQMGVGICCQVVLRAAIRTSTVGPNKKRIDDNKKIVSASVPFRSDRRFFVVRAFVIFFKNPTAHKILCIIENFTIKKEKRVQNSRLGLFI